MAGFVDAGDGRGCEVKRAYLLITNELMSDFMPRGCDTSTEAYHNAFHIPAGIEVLRVWQPSESESLWRMDLRGDGLPPECNAKSRQLKGTYHTFDGEITHLRLEVAK